MGKVSPPASNDMPHARELTDRIKRSERQKRSALPESPKRRQRKQPLRLARMGRMGLGQGNRQEAVMVEAMVMVERRRNEVRGMRKTRRDYVIS